MATLPMNLLLMRTIPERTNKKQPGNSRKLTAATTDDALRHLAFDNSVQANIISTVSSGKIIMANRAACKLLGYSRRELLTKGREAIFDINESSFKKMLRQRMAEGHSVALVTAIQKSSKQVPCEITSAVFMDDDGVKKAITTIADMSQSILKQKNIDIKKEKIVANNIILAKSKQKNIDEKKNKKAVSNSVLAKSRQRNIDTKKEKIVDDNIVLAQAKSDARQTENNKWKKSVGKVSYDVMWDWDIAGGQIYVGDSIEEVFGYKVRNNTVSFTDFERKLLPEEKDTVEKKLWKTLASRNKSWNDSYMLRRCDGSVAHTSCRASIVRDKKGKAVHLIGAIKDISSLRELEKKLEEQITLKKELSEIFHVAARLSFDGIWDWNLLTGDFFLGEGFEELFGYTAKNNIGNMAADWANYLHPDDRETVEKGLQDAIASSAARWEQGYRFVRVDGSIARVFTRASIIRNADGKACRIIGAMQDISKQNILEERLEQEIKLKERQITEATENARETERSDIGKELHDNVNQLLGASRLFLDMAKRGGANREMCLSRSAEYTTTAIEAIRKLTKGLATDIIKNLGLCEAIDNLILDAMKMTPVKIFCTLESFKEQSVNDKFKLNIFRIVQEHLNNILKHARATKVVLRLSQSIKSIILSVSDNGIGFDTGKKRKGIGVDNIKSRAASYNGTADFVSQSGRGCILTVTFPAANALPDKRGVATTGR
jgi:PAS domain S-box-containing protein